MGNPVLRQRSVAVADPTAADVRELVGDMLDTMEAANGIGLAAPQIAVPRRVVIFFAPPEAVPGGEGEWEDRPDSESIQADPPIILVNPEIELLSEETALGWEGCLSVPGLIGLVPRFTRIRYSGVSPEGRLIQRVASGFHARVVQHECDHLDGCLYPQRMTDLSMLLFETEMHHYRPEAVDEDPV